MTRLIATFSMLLTLASYSQNNVHIGARPGFGFLIAHRPIMQHMPSAHSRSIDLFTEFQTDGSKKWHHVYNMPTWGIGGYFSDVGSSELLGKSATIYSFINFNLIRRDHFRLIYRLGAGVGWVEKIFDLYENRKNIAIGSTVNGTMTMGVEARKEFGRFFTGFGLHLMHFSNASWKVPNLGINIPALQLTLGYKLRDNEVPGVDTTVINKEKTQLRGKLSINVLATAGIKEIKPVGGPKYPIVSVLSQLHRSMGPKGDFLGGLDVIYNSSHIPKLADGEKEVESNLQIIQTGVNIGYMIKVGHLGVYLTKGIYINSRLKADGIFYHRLGAQYFKDRWIANISLKTHFAVADYVEFGIGYRIK